MGWLAKANTCSRRSGLELPLSRCSNKDKVTQLQLIVIQVRGLESAKKQREIAREVWGVVIKL
jgi:hypothetical protein